MRAQRTTSLIASVSWLAHMATPPGPSPPARAVGEAGRAGGEEDEGRRRGKRPSKVPSSSGFSSSRCLLLRFRIATPAAGPVISSHEAESTRGRSRLYIQCTRRARLPP
ncbi:hypothetical protein CDD83_9064 [Cordyceps sp. RAO-2017]|nr:hypothetical protein CDD83_9064 [Cordyceps sp. RAO-2017]